MKSTERYLMYGLLLAVLVLYILQFTGSEPASVEVETTDSTGVEAIAREQGLIYFVNTDTIWANYDYVRDVNADMVAKKQRYEGQLNSQLSSFEKDVMEFRQNGPNMGQMEVQLKQNDLMKREQEITELKDNLEMKFLTEEQEWNKKLRQKIVGYIDSLTADMPYDYVLGYSLTSNIILANDSLDLTTQVLNGLNGDYKKEKATK